VWNARRNDHDVAFAYATTLTILNSVAATSAADQFQIRIIGRKRCWIGELASSNESSGPIKHNEDRSGSVVDERVVLDRAALIRLLRPVNDEDANVCCAPIYSAQWLIDGRIRGIALIICEIVAAVSNAASDDGSDVAESATGATMAIAVINWSIFFIVFDATSSSRL
jgi:hypothetical protein